ncbi:MAG: TIGR03960 family B12-binding radical SAM protein [Lachnospiraceae bacterium]|nr:TIGR03960 family B12-binding radical SAM protein [Lachnospiraceae bacterium]
MRKTALSDEILLEVDKPVRYIGNEVNSVYKDKDQVAIRYAMCFPDLYEIGMSHLGMQILYDMFNSYEDVWCERVFCPWTDLYGIMKKEDIPLFALESQESIKDFDFVGITLQYEMCYTNVLELLDLSQIPIFASERGEDDPIVIGGGPCTYNPEPVADFFDIIYIGEGETKYRELFDLYRECKDKGFLREEFLHRATAIGGIYVPSMYRVEYDGTEPSSMIKSFTPVYDDVPAKVKREVAVDLSAACYPTKPVVPFMKVTQDRVVLEIMRGCIRGCRFCQAGMIYRPLRERSVDLLKEYAVTMLENTGHEEISLSSLSSSDYSKLPELVDFLIEYAEKNRINISLPSLRVDAFSLDVMSKVQDKRKSSVTFAPEAGSQRMRDIINKGLTEDEILNGCTQAFLGGWSRIKLYFMLGLPGETEEDMEGIAVLSDKIARLYYDLIPKEERKGRVSIVTSTSFFVPKPFTPFQWAPMDSAEDFLDKAHFVNDKINAQLNKKSIKYNWHEAHVSILEGVLARGDRRLAQVIYDAYKNGAMFDAWSETFKEEHWLDAFLRNGVTMEFYTARARDMDELLPWDFIDVGVSKDFLKNEWDKAKKGLVTENCRQKCSLCGAMLYGGGICHGRR